MNTHTTSVPAHIVRPQPYPKSATRVIMERVFAESRGAWLTIEEAASRAGFGVGEARQAIGKLRGDNLIHSDGHRPPRYRAGASAAMLLAQERARAAQDAGPMRSTGTYEGRELQPFTGRPGAMDAFRLPTLENGRRVPRKAPALISSKSQEIVR